MPSAPYCTTGDVYLMTLFSNDPSGTDFGDGGIIRKDLVTYWVAQIASQIDMLYSSVGYEIPLTAMTGESWPDYQTNFLKYFNAVGAAAFTHGSPSTPPMIAFVGGQRVERSFYEVEWRRLIEDVRKIGMRVPDTTCLIRADTRVGSPADYMLSEGRPPLTDFLEGYNDPTKWDFLRDFTNRHKNYMNYVNEFNLPSAETEGSIEWLWYWHKQMGYTYDAD